MRRARIERKRQFIGRKLELRWRFLGREFQLVRQRLGREWLVKHVERSLAGCWSGEFEFDKFDWQFGYGPFRQFDHERSRRVEQRSVPDRRNRSLLSI